MIALKIKLLCKHTDFNCKIKMVGGRSGGDTEKEQSGRGTKCNLKWQRDKGSEAQSGLE